MLDISSLPSIHQSSSLPHVYIFPASKHPLSAIIPPPPFLLLTDQTRKMVARNELYAKYRKKVEMKLGCIISFSSFFPSFPKGWMMKKRWRIEEIHTESHISYFFHYYSHEMFTCSHERMTEEREVGWCFRNNSLMTAGGRWKKDVWQHILFDVLPRSLQSNLSAPDFPENHVHVPMCTLHVHVYRYVAETKKNLYRQTGSPTLIHRQDSPIHHTQIWESNGRLNLIFFRNSISLRYRLIDLSRDCLQKEIATLKFNSHLSSPISTVFLMHFVLFSLSFIL